jgi:hypothetical protein
VLAEVEGWAAQFEGLVERIGPRFARPEVGRRAAGFLGGLLGDVARKNGWQLAEHARETTPDGMQRLLTSTQMDSLRLFEESKLAHVRVSSGLSPAEAGVALVMVSPATLIMSRHRHNSTRLNIPTDPPIQLCVCCPAISAGGSRSSAHRDLGGGHGHLPAAGDGDGHGGPGRDRAGTVMAAPGPAAPRSG